jgi:hypothetical protein
MYPDSDREVGVPIYPRGPDDIEVKTVFRDLIADVVAPVANTMGRIGRRLSAPVPRGIQRLGNRETQRFLL